MSKFVWATTTFGGGLYVEVFAKHYYLHWQKRTTRGLVDRFGNCMFTSKTRTTKERVVELSPFSKTSEEGG